MEELWNTMISYVMMSLPTKGFEPGSMEYNIFPRINLHAITSKSLRNVMLQSFNEFNHGYFFIIMQIALLIYCPSVALSIIYQSYELQIDKEQIDDQQQLTQPCQSQYSQEKQQLFMQRVTQFIQSFFQNYQAQMQQIQIQEQVQAQSQSQPQPQQCMQQFINYNKQLGQQIHNQLQPRAITIKLTQKNNENGAVKITVKVAIQIPVAGQVNQKVVWQNFIVTF